MSTANDDLLPVPLTDARDRRIARAMLWHLTGRSPGSNPTPWQISFSNHEDTCEQMDEVCEVAGWKPKSLKAQQRALSAVALQLHRYGALERGRLSNGELTWRNEARWQYAYYLSAKWLKRLSPQQWAHLRYEPGPFSTPEGEMQYLLDRAFPNKA